MMRKRKPSSIRFGVFLSLFVQKILRFCWLGSEIGFCSEELDSLDLSNSLVVCFDGLDLNFSLIGHIS